MIASSYAKSMFRDDRPSGSEPMEIDSIEASGSRLKLVKTVFHAKQLINHKKIRVNDKIISKPNFAFFFRKNAFLDRFFYIF